MTRKYFIMNTAEVTQEQLDYALSRCIGLPETQLFLNGYLIGKTNDLAEEIEGAIEMTHEEMIEFLAEQNEELD